MTPDSSSSRYFNIVDPYVFVLLFLFDAPGSVCKVRDYITISDYVNYHGQIQDPEVTDLQPTGLDIKVSQPRCSL